MLLPALALVLGVVAGLGTGGKLRWAAHYGMPVRPRAVVDARITS